MAPEIETALPGFRSEDPRIILSSFLLMLQEALGASFDNAAGQRAHQQEAMRDWWRRHALTPDEIASLLAQEADTAHPDDEGDVAGGV